VWLAVNSGAPGMQGTGIEKNRRYHGEFGMSCPILIDETGAVGRIYEAKTTPHLYVIDEKGVLVYRGALDNAPLGKPAPEGSPAMNYVEAALADLEAGRPVQISETKPYGCSVKYAK
jgi:hypothetical protein